MTLFLLSIQHYGGIVQLPRLISPVKALGPLNFALPRIPLFIMEHPRLIKIFIENDAESDAFKQRFEGLIGIKNL